MTSQRFELNLLDTTRSGRLITLLLLGIYSLMGLSVWVAIRLGNNGPSWLLATTLAGGGGYLGWRAYKQAAVVPAVVIITSTALRVEDLRPEPRLSQTLPLADITTYRYASFNGAEELRLNQAAAPPLKLCGTRNLAETGDFGGMVAAFEQAIAAAPNSTSVATRREKSFFERPVSTYVLVLFTLVLGGIGYFIVTNNKPVRGNTLGALGSYFAYLAAWRAAAPRRNAA